MKSKKAMKYKEVWFFGKDNPKLGVDDFVDYYLRRDNKVKINCHYGLINLDSVWYNVCIIDGEKEKSVAGFKTFKEAKEYALTI